MSIAFATTQSNVEVVRHIAETENISLREATKKLVKTTLFDLIMDETTKMYDEPKPYLEQCYDIEKSKGLDGLIDYVTR